MGLSQRAAARLLDINDRTATSSYRRGQVLELTIIHSGHGWPCKRGRGARSCRAGGADQCPKLGVGRTQRGHAATAESDVVDGARSQQKVP